MIRIVLLDELPKDFREKATIVDFRKVVNDFAQTNEKYCKLELNNSNDSFLRNTMISVRNAIQKLNQPITVVRYNNEIYLLKDEI